MLDSLNDDNLYNKGSLSALYEGGGGRAPYAQKSLSLTI